MTALLCRYLSMSIGFMHYLHQRRMYEKPEKRTDKGRKEEIGTGNIKILTHTHTQREGK